MFPPEPPGPEHEEGRYESVIGEREHQHEPGFTERRHEPAFTERRYTTKAGDAVLISDTDDPSRLKPYLGAEIHTGFFSVFWASRVCLPDAVRDFLGTRWADPGRVWLDPEEHRGISNGIVIDERGVRTSGIARAIRSARHGRNVYLLRLEYPTYTFVWRAPWEDDDEEAAEVGLMCQYRVDSLIAGLVRRTATEEFARNADDVSRRAVDVVARGIASR
jgi:hypothetical protein